MPVAAVFLLAWVGNGAAFAVVRNRMEPSHRWRRDSFVVALVGRRALRPGDVTLVRWCRAARRIGVAGGQPGPPGEGGDPLPLPAPAALVLVPDGAAVAGPVDLHPLHPAARMRVDGAVPGAVGVGAAVHAGWRRSWPSGSVEAYGSSIRSGRAPCTSASASASPTGTAGASDGSWIRSTNRWAPAAAAEVASAVVARTVGVTPPSEASGGTTAATLNWASPISADALPASSPCRSRASAVAFGLISPVQLTSTNSGTSRAGTESETSTPTSIAAAAASASRTPTASSAAAPTRRTRTALACEQSRMPSAFPPETRAKACGPRP